MTVGAQPSFTKATKFGSKLRLSLSGPSGSGKTYTSLVIATELLDTGQRVALIDTEHGSAVKAADSFDFDHLRLEDNYHPDRYVAAIKLAEQAGVYGVLIIDSLSHAWKGAGGLLEEIDRIATRKFGGNSYRAWNEGTAIQNNLVGAILASPLNIIATCRSKQDYVIEKDDRGKMSPRRVGLAPVQRDDIQYEFDIWGSLDADNTLTIEKSRCRELQNAVIRHPDASVAKTIRAWLAGEPPPPPPPPGPVEVIQSRMECIAKAEDMVLATVKRMCLMDLEIDPTVAISSLQDDQLAAIIKWCNKRYVNPA